jgi:Ni/Fe-hydrogenase subunit HybB-like protein
MWPQARSPLLWDVFAVGTYATVSLLFWYMGMVPDLATFRDRATKRWQQLLYGLLALGWNGSSRHWMRFEKAYLLLAALATPLVLSVHSVVSFDFATSQLPGWHTTIFPPYFVAGAVFGGFAMVLTLSIPCREWFGLKHLITHRHIENMAKVMLATGYDRVLRVLGGVLHGVVQPAAVRAIRVSQSTIGALRLGVLDDGHL